MQRSSRPNSFNKKQPVEDLRLKLNRKREEKNVDGSENNNLPPPDPAYNFLKDPLRGDNFNKNDKKFNPKFRRSFHDNRRNIEGEERSNLKKDENCKPNKMFDNKNGQIEEHKANNGLVQVPKKDLQLQSSSNIKIQVSSSTGARKCIVDETTFVEVPKVKDAPLQPNRKQPQREAQKFYVSKGKERSHSFNEKYTENDKKQDGNYKKRYANKEYKKKEITQQEEKKNVRKEVMFKDPKKENCDGI